MKNKINVSISVFEQNFMAAKHAYVLNSSMEASACASAFIGSTSPIDEERLRMAKKVVRGNTGFLSTLGRGNASQIVAATIAAEPDMQVAMEQIVQIHGELNRRFFNSDYLVLAAVMIYRNAEVSERMAVVDRMRKIYTGMRKSHPLLTGREDLANVALMALSGIPLEELGRREKVLFDEAKRYYVMKGKAQYLSCMLSVFEGEPAEMARHAKETQNVLKTYGVRFDSTAFPVIGAVSALVDSKDLELIGASIRDCSAQLKAIRGMGAMGAGKRIRNMIATAIVLDAYTSDADAKVRSSVSAAIISAIIATEIAIIVAATTASAAAASSSS